MTRSEIADSLPHLYHCLAPYLYCAQLESGVVKIGSSKSIVVRLQALHDTCAKRLNQEITRVSVVPAKGNRFDAERSIIRALKAAGGTQLPRTREWFSGITFDAACRAVRDAARVANHPSFTDEARAARKQAQPTNHSEA